MLCNEWPGRTGRSQRWQPVRPAGQERRPPALRPTYDRPFSIYPTCQSRENNTDADVLESRCENLTGSRLKQNLALTY